MNFSVTQWLAPALVVLGMSGISATAFSAAVNPALLQARKDAEAKGYIFETSREAIIASAKREGKLRVISGLDPKGYPSLIAAFKKNHPYIDVHMEEITGADSAQRFILELKTGRVKEWDVMHMSGDVYNEYEGHKKNFDILGMASQGVLTIPAGMTDQKNRNVVFPTSVFSVVPYNPSLISPDKVPDTWDDFLKPALKGKRFMIDIRGGVKDLAAMVSAWGVEKVVGYARRLAAQEPIWAVGYTRTLSSITAGEAPLAHMVNWHTVVRGQEKAPSGLLAYKVVEPVPVRVTVSDAIVRTAANPYSGLLWLEFLASPEAQAIIDKYEPLKSNLFVPGSEVGKALAGKKVSISSPEEVDELPQLMEKVIAALGFPKVQAK
jgi:ABC-type Fe3+ transport system substrate-binding protein